jgi:hypothetical protein
MSDHFSELLGVDQGRPLRLLEQFLLALADAFRLLPQSGLALTDVLRLLEQFLLALADALRLLPQSRLALADAVQQLHLALDGVFRLRYQPGFETARVRGVK